MHEQNHKLQPNCIHTNIIYMYCIMYVLCMYGGIIKFGNAAANV